MGAVVIALDVGADRLASLVEGFELLAPDAAFLESSVYDPLVAAFGRSWDAGGSGVVGGATRRKQLASCTE